MESINYKEFHGEVIRTPEILINCTGSIILSSSIKVYDCDLRIQAVEGAKSIIITTSKCRIWVKDPLSLDLLKVTESDISQSNFSKASIDYCALKWSNIAGSNFNKTIFGTFKCEVCNLGEVNFSGCKGIISQTEWMDENFERVNDGWIVYRGSVKYYPEPDYWNLDRDSYIEEVINPDRSTECGCGINFATKEWINDHMDNPEITSFLLKYGTDICVPYYPNGKARCSKLWKI